LINLSRETIFQGLKGSQIMNIQLTKSQIGLDGVPAAETVLSHVDGERGELIIAGEHIADLAGKSSFEGVTARLASAPRANAPSSGCPNCCRRRAACRLSTAFAPLSLLCAQKTGSSMKQRSSVRFR
jgi:hypothetical protein